MIDKENTLKNIARHKNQIMVVGNEEVNEMMKGYNPTSFLVGLGYGLELAEKIVMNQPQADKWIHCEVKDIIDTIISHNEIVALWVEEETEDVRYDKQIWRGMAWDIPNSLKGCRFIKIFGTVPESIAEADTINIRIETPKPYKKEGAE